MLRVATCKEDQQCCCKVLALYPFILIPQSVKYQTYNQAGKRLQVFLVNFIFGSLCSRGPTQRALTFSIFLSKLDTLNENIHMFSSFQSFLARKIFNILVKLSKSALITFHLFFHFVSLWKICQTLLKFMPGVYFGGQASIRRRYHLSGLVNRGLGLILSD